MADRRTSKAQDRATGSEPEVDDGRSREGAVHPYRDRRENEPALATFETDAEAGTRSGSYTGQSGRRDAQGVPIDPAREAAPDGDDADVRIGPGDAGQQRKPRVLPEKMQGRGDSWGRALGVIAVGFVVVVVIALVF